MSDEIDRLAELLQACGAQVTFDPGANHRHACTFCGRLPRETHALRDIGHYPGGAIIRRPVCESCTPIADRIDEKRKEPIKRLDALIESMGPPTEPTEIGLADLAVLLTDRTIEEP